MKAKASRIPPGTGSLSVQLGPHRLGSILEDEKIVLFRNGKDSGHLRHPSSQMNRHQGLGSGGDGCLNCIRIDIQILADIGKNRFGPYQGNGGGGSNERIGRSDHLVPRPHPDCPQCQMERTGSIGNPSGERTSAILGKLLFKGLNLWSLDVPAFIQNGSKGLHQAIANLPRFQRKIRVRN